MLPGWIRIGPVLPSTGERIWVNSRFSRAASALAFGYQIGGLGVVLVLGRDRILRQQLLIAVGLGLGGASVATRIVIGRLIGARDRSRNRQIALLDHLAFLEDGR